MAKYLRKQCDDLNEVASDYDDDKDGDDDDDDDGNSKDTEVVEIRTGQVLTPANIRLDVDVLKTSFVFVYRRRLEDVLKTS